MALEISEVAEFARIRDAIVAGEDFSTSRHDLWRAANAAAIVDLRERAATEYARGVQDTIARLTSDEAVEAGAVVLRERFERWGVTGHGLDTTRAILAAAASSLAAEPTTDLGERHG
jgi:rhodanese-related sulfurtransferase